MLMELSCRHRLTARRTIGSLTGSVDYSTVSRARKELDSRMRVDFRLTKRLRN
ncbi:MAG: hypothetical protein IT574_03480 [Candidatus Aureabacteria bacterium]|nr:hypothetical protein [Candidatus Auribacterota bacterium]NLW94486.1 hypothetical protein [Chlamydiota bacterium]HOE26152.1 hypothetical protein [bacterium]HQM52858.1 hypothetical protein [bacterium]